MRGNWVVRLPSWLGDTVMATPTIRALARSVDGTLTLWGRSSYCRLLQSSGIRADLLPYTRGRGLGGIRDGRRTVASLSTANARGVLLLPNHFEAALLAALAGIPQRVGYATDARKRLLTLAIPSPNPCQTLHHADRYAALLSALSVEPPHSGDGLLGAPLEATQRVAGWLSGRQRLLALVPGSANGAAKQWPPAAFGALAEAASRRWQATPVLLGSADDQAIAAAVQACCSVDCLDLVGHLGVFELAAALKLCRAVVSNDTGAAHLAAALGCPTLVVFGPTDPALTKPRGPTVRIVSSGAFCQPCRAQICPLDHRCMVSLAPERVLVSLDLLWNSSAPVPLPRVDAIL